ncbi:MAG: imelysin family protein, partial [Bacteroidota bacterium]
MKRLSLLFCVLFMFAACGEDDTGSNDPVDNFDRKTMLTHWADNIIVPAFTDFAAKANNLNTAIAYFSNTPDATTLADLREQWEQASRVWQRVDMFEIEKGEEIFLRNNLNIYPVDVAALEANITDG